MAMAISVATCAPSLHAARGPLRVGTSEQQQQFRHAEGSSQAGRTSRKNRVAVVASYRRHGGGGDFLAGFMLGGLVFGALGYVFAPEVKRSLAGIEGAKPRYWDDDDMEETRKGLSEKISQLNAAIDSVSAQLRESENGVKEYELSA